MNQSQDVVAGAFAGHLFIFVAVFVILLLLFASFKLNQRNKAQMRKRTDVSSSGQKELHIEIPALIVAYPKESYGTTVATEGSRLSYEQAVLGDPSYKCSQFTIE
ncbi:hypothetical protein L596_028554 [Steinernema carpocapsae]|uniref:Uncharacterized protein n=1 Tax=Steinernema carpocapsae TaxID=34508 RepID=A0A4U5LYR5_STECR|nr:hypothetical protein L596_028554 [Steinernema carpocapsae]